MFEYYIERIYNLNSLLLLGSSAGLRKLCRNLSDCFFEHGKNIYAFFQIKRVQPGNFPVFGFKLLIVYSWRSRICLPCCFCICCILTFNSSISLSHLATSWCNFPLVLSMIRNVWYSWMYRFESLFIASLYICLSILLYLCPCSPSWPSGLLFRVSNG